MYSFGTNPAHRTILLPVVLALHTRSLGLSLSHICCPCHLPPTFPPHHPPLVTTVLLSLNIWSFKASECKWGSVLSWFLCLVSFIYSHVSQVIQVVAHGKVSHYLQDWNPAVCTHWCMFNLFPWLLGIALLKDAIAGVFTGCWAPLLGYLSKRGIARLDGGSRETSVLSHSTCAFCCSLHRVF